MLLAVDIGNSNIKFGTFDSEHLLSKFSIPTNLNSTKEELTSAVDNRIDKRVADAIVCSVVPDADTSMREFLIGHGVVKPIFLTNDFDFGLKINYEPLSAIGTDRLVNAFGVAEKYGVPCIVCSFGTAMTIDAVDQNREIRGGVIAPGMKTMAKALHLNTAKLPEVEIEKPKSFLGNTTVSSIRSGIFNGQVAMAEGLIQRIKKEIGDNPKVVATGGFASLIAENAPLIDIVDENLLLDGLRLLSDRINN